MSTTTTTVLDVGDPSSASRVGVELARTTEALAVRLASRDAITTVAACEQAVTDRQQIADAITSVEAFFSPLKRLAHQLHKALCDRESAILAPLRIRDKRIVDAIREFKTDQDRQRQEAERAEADRQRRDREAQAAAEAAALERQGEPALAEAVIAEAVTAPPPVVALPDVTKQVEGLRFTRTWKWKFAGGPADVKATPPEFRARAMRLLPREFLTVDEAKLAKFATGMKDTARVPGIDFYYVDTPRR